MRTRFLKSFAVGFATLLAVAAGQAGALDIDPGASGLDLAQGCSDATCFFGVLYDTVDSASAPSGSFDLDTGALSLSFDFDIAPLCTRVPLGAPLRLHLRLKNKAGQSLPGPASSSRYGPDGQATPFMIGPAVGLSAQPRVHMPRKRQKDRIPATIWFRVRVETKVPMARKQHPRRSRRKNLDPPKKRAVHRNPNPLKKKLQSKKQI